jgi:hypothetical protein
LLLCSATAAAATTFLMRAMRLIIGLDVAVPEVCLRFDAKLALVKVLGQLKKI